MFPETRLVEEARSRVATKMEHRELVAQALEAVLFVSAAGLLLVLAPIGSVSVTELVLLVLTMALLGRLEFEIGTGFTVPTQLAFVPMLFFLPPAIVPLAVAAALALDRLPDIVAGRRHPQRLLSVLGDALFAVGPAAVFAAAGIESPSLADWPVYLLALVAQLAGDFACSTTREWIARGVAPRQQLDVLREVWLVDVLVTPTGLLAAYATTQQQHAYMFVLPLGVLLKVFARERHGRIGNAIELSAAYRGTALLLGDVIENDDAYTGRHSEGVVAVALAIADELRLGEQERRLVEFGAMLHDIGKISTPKEILNKPGPLDVAERELMRDHVVTGQRMLDRVGGTLHDVGEVVRASHERFDGRGYPDGLAGEAIARPARIIAVADTYSAMTTVRPYRPALTHETALAELRANAGTQFDPEIVEAALTVLDVSHRA
ncbi:MAG: HD-GYP domain-containing protein [Actinomycetota bacterium]|nr:HD-GYP domain-containing protein [Actinomycetota bacterium]